MCPMCLSPGEATIPAIPSMFPSLDIPLHVEHMNERLGQLVMLHLGGELSAHMRTCC
jgi:hypothetical protein